MDLLFLGPPSAYETLAPAAEAVGVRLYPAHPSGAEPLLSVYGGVLDGAVVCGGSAETLGRLGTIAPRLPVAVVDLSVGSSPEALSGAVQAEAVLQRVLEELRFVEEERGTAERMVVARELSCGTWVAHATFRLAGVASPRSPGEAERFAEAAGRWHLSVADVVGRLPEWVTLRVRYAAAGRTLHAGVLLTAEGRDAHQATSRLDEARRHLNPLLREGLVADGAYALDGTGHEVLLAPIRAQAAVTLLAPEADELAPLFDTFHSDPWVQSDGVALAEGEADGVALPVAGPNGALGPLLQVLVSLNSPAVVDVACRPAPLTSEERGRAADLARLHGGGDPSPFVAVLDEAQRFASGHEPAVLMAEGRKVGLGLVALTQRASSLSRSFREAALANAGLVGAMRCGVEDAALLAPYLAPAFSPTDLLGLGRGEAALRIQLPSGEPAAPFLLRALPPQHVANPR